MNVMYVLDQVRSEVIMNTEGLKILKARLWDQRIATREAIRWHDKAVSLSRLDELCLIENEMLEEFEKLRTAIAKDISTVEGWLKQLEELKFETK